MTVNVPYNYTLLYCISYTAYPNQIWSTQVLYSYSSSDASTGARYSSTYRCTQTRTRVPGGGSHTWTWTRLETSWTRSQVARLVFGKIEPLIKSLLIIKVEDLNIDRCYEVWKIFSELWTLNFPLMLHYVLISALLVDLLLLLLLLKPHCAKKRWLQ